MKFYARISKNILQQGYGLDEDSFEATKQKYPEDTFLETDSLCAPDTHYFQNNAVVKKSEKPSTSCFWNDTTFSWVENSQLKEVEIKRNRYMLLSSSDWTQLPNNPLSIEKQTAWANYRQELRDITTQSGYPFDVVWPTKPN